jgi:hypothetical protein
MDVPMHIPWTRMNKLREPKPEPKNFFNQPDLFERLKDLLVSTLAPFPEAREALCLALVAFDRQCEAPGGGSTG